MPARSVGQSAAPVRSPLYGWAIVALLTVGYACAFIDRQILNLLAPKIQHDFVLSDVQTSLLLGPAFAVFFAFSGVAFGRLADRGNRSRVIVFAITAWSVLTAVCGLAPNFPALFAARIGVGVGEAALAPSAVSLVSDLFPPAKRNAPMAVFGLGGNLGNAFAYFLGAALIPAAPLMLPLLGLRQPWQATFIFVGIPGLLIACVALFVKEPARRELMNPQAVPARDWAYLRQRLPLYGLIVGGASLMGLQGYAIGAWEASFYTRRFGWTSETIGLVIGVKSLSSSILGTLCATRLAVWLRRTGYADANLRTMLTGAAMIILPASLAWQMPDPRLVVPLSGLTTFSLVFTLNFVGVTFCDVTPNEKRGLVYSVYLLISVILGMGVGPLMVAVFSQYLYRGNLANSLSTTGLLFAPSGLILLLLSRRHFNRALKDAVAWSRNSA
jgi:MFS family permease